MTDRYPQPWTVSGENPTGDPSDFLIHDARGAVVASVPSLTIAMYITKLANQDPRPKAMADNALWARLTNRLSNLF